VKTGRRVLGIAESYRGDHSTLAGSVVRADRVVDGFVFDQCTVGGTDVTATICRMVDRLDREDVRAIFVAGIALAWFNVADLHRIQNETGLPVLSVSFEESPGLASAIREEFDDEAANRRIDIYDAQPARRPVDVADRTLYLRTVGIEDDEAKILLRAFTPEGARPEPLRVARLAARAADAYKRS
jgi:endonuclease V-like protein UPF0215 family